METKRERISYIGVARFMSEKTDLAIGCNEQQKGHYIVKKQSFQQEDIPFLNIYAPKMGATKHIKHILKYLKDKNNSNKETTWVLKSTEFDSQISHNSSRPK